jgi:hypothetical protein
MTNNIDAKRAFNQHMASVKKMLTRLQNAAENNFHTDFERINWADVGSLGRLEELLKQAHDQTFHEGEYAS